MLLLSTLCFLAVFSMTLYWQVNYIRTESFNSELTLPTIPISKSGPDNMDYLSVQNVTMRGHARDLITQIISLNKLISKSRSNHLVNQ